MNTGLPGTGLATMFYVLSVLVMPVYELIRMARGYPTSARRWLLILRHSLVSGVMFMMFYGTLTYLPSIKIGTVLIESPYVAIAVVAAMLVTFFVLLPRLRPLHARARS